MTRYKMPDGTVRGIRTRDLLDNFLDATANRDTPGARLLLNASECVSEGGGMLHEIVQALADATDEGETIR